MSKETGGHAYTQFIRRHDGMSLRDYFAARAMPQVMAATFDRMGKLTAEEAAFVVANAAYQVADAMLAERLK